MEQRIRATDVPVRPAATVMLVRDGETGLEVFMLRRTLSASFARGQYVFPGGRVDDADSGERFEPVCDGFDDAAASRSLELDHGGLAWYVAAIRECFEEAGVLLARRRDEDHLVAFDDPDTTARFEGARHEVHAGERSLVDLCVDEQLLLVPERLHFVDWWLTPLGEARRFDTRFFLAAAPTAQSALHDDRETIASLWMRPVDALAQFAAGELSMFVPTAVRLRWLEPYATVAEATAAAVAIGTPQLVAPRLVLSDDDRVIGVARNGDEGFDQLRLPEYVVASWR